ncbi:hypothetical protein BTVI_59456 [Pitangus sulphuratus]|nr:hypothetical protein BTVI_59456 [Pitangus sulphuratus]
MGKRCCRSRSRYSPAAHGADQTMVRQTVQLSSVEVHDGADSHLQPMEDHMLEQVHVPEEHCDPMEKPEQVSFQDLGTLWRPTLDQSIPEELYHMERTHSGEFIKNCSLWKGFMVQKFVEDCLLWVGCHTGEGKRV